MWLLDIDLGDQRSVAGMLLGCFGALGVLEVPLEVPWGPLGASLEVLGRPWRPWERPVIVLGGPWGDFGGLGRSLVQSWELRCWYCVGLDDILRCHVL